MGISEAAIDELRVEIRIDLDKFAKQIAGLKDDVSKTRKHTEDAFKGIKESVEHAFQPLKNFTGLVRGIGELLAVREFVEFGKEALEMGEAISSAAERVGFSVKRFAELKAAAAITGISFSDLQQVLQTFSARVGEAARGEGTFGKVLDDLKIKLLNQRGELKSNQELFEEFRAKVEATGNASIKASLEVAGFGKSGQKISELVSHLDELVEKAREAGLVLGTDTIESLSKAEKKMLLASEVIKTQLTVAFANLTPIITAATEGIAKYTGKLEDLVDFGPEKLLAADKSELERIRALQAEIDAKVSGGPPKSLFGKITSLFDFDPKKQTEINKREIDRLTDEIDSLERGLKVKRDRAEKADKPPATGGKFTVGLTAEQKSAIQKAKEVEIEITDALARSTTDRVVIAQNEFTRRIEKIGQFVKDSNKAERLRVVAVQTLSNDLLDIEKDRIVKEVELQQKGAKSIQEAVDKVNEKSKEEDKARLERIRDFSKQVSEEIAENGRINFSALAKTFEKEFLTKVISLSVSSGLDRILGSLELTAASAGGTGGIAGQAIKLGKFFGFFAGGGDIPSGGFGVVGERGPELVRGPASVSPIVGGGSPIIQIITDAPGNQVRVKESGGQPNIIQISHGAVNEGFAKGHYDGAIRGRYRVTPRTVR